MVSERLRKKVEERRYKLDLIELSGGTPFGIFLNSLIYTPQQARREVKMIRELKKEYAGIYSLPYDPFTIEP